MLKNPCPWRVVTVCVHQSSPLRRVLPTIVLYAVGYWVSLTASCQDADGSAAVYDYLNVSL